MSEENPFKHLKDEQDKTESFRKQLDEQKKEQRRKQYKDLNLDSIVIKILTQFNTFANYGSAEG